MLIPPLLQLSLLIFKVDLILEWLLALLTPRLLCLGLLELKLDLLDVLDLGPLEVMLDLLELELGFVDMLESLELMIHLVDHPLLFPDLPLQDGYLVVESSDLLSSGLLGYSLQSQLLTRGRGGMDTETHNSLLSRARRW
ncbi:hypothetical protein J3E69DRAFT_334811 [Trichoderma sp. SZMC 28015]